MYLCVRLQKDKTGLDNETLYQRSRIAVAAVNSRRSEGKVTTKKLHLKLSEQSLSMTSSSITRRKVLMAIDASRQAEHAFDCK